MGVGPSLARACMRLTHPRCHGAVSPQSFTTGACCAKTLDSSGLPDFTDLDIKQTAGCDAPNAERIVKGLCAGKQVCTVRPAPSVCAPWTALVAAFPTTHVM